MRGKFLWLATTLAVALALVSEVGLGAQPQGKGKKGGPPDKFGQKGDFFGKKGKKGPPPLISFEQISERILTLDLNGDGKVSLDELPERMQHLVAMGDVNRDGSLDGDEVQKLSITLESVVELVVPFGKGPPDGKGKGKKGPPDGKGKGKKGFFGDDPGGGFFLPPELERRLDQIQKDLDELRRLLRK